MGADQLHVDWMALQQWLLILVTGFFRRPSKGDIIFVLAKDFHLNCSFTQNAFQHVENYMKVEIAFKVRSCPMCQYDTTTEMGYSGRQICLLTSVLQYEIINTLCDK